MLGELHFSATQGPIKVVERAWKTGWWEAAKGGSPHEEDRTREMEWWRGKKVKAEDSDKGRDETERLSTDGDGNQKERERERALEKTRH